MFPNAKFIYLMRNPYTVFESTRSFFTNTIQPLRLQDISNEQIESNFIEVYRRLFYKYEEQKHLIPEGNLVEVRLGIPETTGQNWQMPLFGRQGQALRFRKKSSSPEACGIFPENLALPKASAVRPL